MIITQAGEVRCPEDGCVDILQGAPSEHLESMFQKFSSIRSGKEVVIESPVWSGYWPLWHSNRTLTG